MRGGGGGGGGLTASPASLQRVSAERESERAHAEFGEVSHGERAREGVCAQQKKSRSRRCVGREHCRSDHGDGSEHSAFVGFTANADALFSFH